MLRLETQSDSTLFCIPHRIQMMTSTVPSWLRGLWKRLLIETADRQRDAQTQVLYLQTSSFGDLRLPSDRSDLKQANFSSPTRDDVLALSKQQGFAGIAQFEQGQCQWVTAKIHRCS
jgi:hypothetical protein